VVRKAGKKNNRFKPTGRSSKEATLLFVWERKCLGRRKYDLLFDRE